MTATRWLTAALTTCLVGFGALAGAADAPDNWDGLVQIKPKRMDMVYVLPGADFRPYTKVMLDKTEVAFRKDWQKNMNDTRSMSRKIDDEQAAKIMAAASSNFSDVWTKALEKAGYPVVTAPGPDVLRLSTAIVNLYINAPDTMDAGRVTTYTAEAGEATLILEARDSQTNALLGRVVDRRETRSSVAMQSANRVTNQADFRSLFSQWASIAGKGLEELKAVSPVPADADAGPEAQVAATGQGEQATNRVTVFEFLLALYAIVAGLGVSLLVTSVGQMIEARDRVRLYWVHICWIALTFVGHVVSWFTIWRFRDHAPWTVLQALLLLSVPILLYLISHLAVPDLEDDRIHDMRDYYFRHARWTQGLLLGVVVAGALSHILIEGNFDLSGARGVRASLILILLPGIISLNPRLHAAQAVLLSR